VHFLFAVICKDDGAALISRSSAAAFTSAGSKLGLMASEFSAP
jgi:hypothetical protein